MHIVIGKFSLQNRIREGKYVDFCQEVPKDRGYFGDLDENVRTILNLLWEKCVYELNYWVVQDGVQGWSLLIHTKCKYDKNTTNIRPAVPGC